MAQDEQSMAQVAEQNPQELPELEGARNMLRWISEASFFDRLADQLGVRLAPLDAQTLQRYREHRQPWFDKEFRFQLLGDLRGKRVLDVGCGEGTNAVLMARLGARVTGIDISPRSIQLCNRRAELEGMGEATQFLCSPLETAILMEGAFDVIWGDGVLHHVIPELDRVMQNLLQWARPGALFIFSEPVSLLPWLRQLRKGIPIHTDATPGERPLEAAEVARLQRYLPGLRMEWFDFLGRLTRFVLVNNNYERSSLPRKLVASALQRLDRAVLSVPTVESLGGMCVMYGNAP